MALEALVFQQGSYSYGCSDIYVLGGGGSYCLGLEEDSKVCFETPHNYNLESSPSSLMVQASVKERGSNTNIGLLGQGLSSVEAPAATMGRLKRRRTRSTKNKEEKENQRMTHIAVERNRRKQMNDYLAVLRSMMPPSYVQKGDQASIIGGALNFVKELEQLLQCMEAQKRSKQPPADGSLSSSVLSGFFSFPQYSAEKNSGIADIEVTMVERHANIKVLSRKHPKQLLEMVARLHSLHLFVLHLNVTTVDNMVLYSFCVKVEDDSQLTSVNEIAAAVKEMVGRIQLEAQLIT
ncbi:transcription factor bHLH94-like [Corylus avellana]|uniref:transcription factor bHLH94-like n=1 Tax=Corylus avellana TaxID=13451 RepID=UPI001E20D45C|nr:transcription factor bHLH94-like [Corylus avellana]